MTLFKALLWMTGLIVVEALSEGNIAPLLLHGLLIVRAMGLLLAGWILIAYLWYLPEEKGARWQQEDPEVRSPPPRAEPGSVLSELEPVAAEKPS